MWEGGDVQPDVLVPVFLASERALGVVEVHTAQVLEADVALELGHCARRSDVSYDEHRDDAVRGDALVSLGIRI